MLPTKEQLIQHLSDKMTNQDIATIYNITFQKVLQLIRKYKLNQKELRKVDKYIVYEHWLNGEVIFVGSGVWYRCRRSSNRRNSEYRRLMEQSKIVYKFVGEFTSRDEAYKYEAELIKKYKQINQARFNKQIST
ncbi:MAG TPA: hypothetical protein VNS08_01370 [Ureibacillus sp.]|nr:hypothetical protein [Ureibacillus sp.]